MQVLAMIEQEVKDLEVEKVENQGCPELCFIEQALEICAQRKASMEQKVFIWIFLAKFK